MAIRQIRIGSMEDIHQYDDTDFDSAVETDHVIKAGAPTLGNEVVRLDDLNAAFAGAASGSFTFVTTIEFIDCCRFRYKERTVTVTNGLVTDIGAESSWIDVPDTTAPPTTATPTTVVPTTVVPTT